jgi:3-deoxy-D-manno-octulosonic-acid transferase
MKYELWPGMLWECQAWNIRVVLVNAIRPGAFHRRLLHKIYAIQVGYASEAEGLVHPRISILGDTRVDRVLERVNGAAALLESKLGPVAALLRKQPTLVAGSIWPADFDVLRPALREALVLKKGWGLVLVPHEIESGFEQKMAQELLTMGYNVFMIDGAGCHRISGPGNTPHEGPPAWVVNRMGILVELYRGATCAFVGGAFSENVHSVWEPALSGAWTACGPRRGKSPESYELEEAGALTIVQDSTQTWGWLESRMAQGRPDPAFTAGLSQRHQGAARKIIEELERNHEPERITAGSSAVAPRTP